MGALHRFHIGDPPSDSPWSGGYGKSMRAASLERLRRVAKATPLQVAAAYAAIVNDWGLLAPPPRRHPPSVYQSASSVRRTARTMVALLQQNTTWQAQRIREARPYRGDATGWKNGTGGRSTRKTATVPLTAGFVGTVLDREPRVVILVGLEGSPKGGTGPSAAAPSLRAYCSTIREMILRTPASRVSCR